MIRRPPRSTLDRSSAASDVYKRQQEGKVANGAKFRVWRPSDPQVDIEGTPIPFTTGSVSYTHLRAHETVLDLVCRLLLEKKKKKIHTNQE